MAGFWLQRPGYPLNVGHQAFSSEFCEAEYLWTAAERAGKKSILINWHSCWPPTAKEGIQLGGAGISINEWRWEPEGRGAVSVFPSPKYIPAYYSLCDCQLFATEEFPWVTPVELRPASGWSGRPTPDEASDAELLEAELAFAFQGSLNKIQPKTWHLLVHKTDGRLYDRVSLHRAKDMDDAVASIGVGEWSERLVERFETDAGEKEGAFRVKLLELSGDGEDLTLFFTPICQLDGPTYYPEEVAQELRDIEEGLPLPTYGPYEAVSLGWIDNDTWSEVEDMEHTWYAEAAKRLLKNHEWDLLFVGDHTPDTFGHMYINKLDPTVNKDAEEVAEMERLELTMYQSIDRMIGEIVEMADDQTIVVVTSDHGIKPSAFAVHKNIQHPLHQILIDAGLLEMDHDPETGEEMVDWSKTKAVQMMSYVWINVKGRYEHGIVEPGEEYEQVRDEVIKALYDYTDPVSGKKPITIALRREDARMIGLRGDGVGDIIYAIGNEFGPAEHGRCLPTAEYGIGSLKGLLLMAGPGIKKGFRLERTVSPLDIVPTLCHLLELPVPKDAEGGIIYQALEDPDAKMKELKKLRKNYQRVLAMLDRRSALTHTY
jgi:predicted AlkP superfamily phosphohydrolase/phosphomutase